MRSLRPAIFVLMILMIMMIAPTRKFYAVEEDSSNISIIENKSKSSFVMQVIDTHNAEKKAEEERKAAEAAEQERIIAKEAAKKKAAEEAAKKKQEELNSIRSSKNKAELRQFLVNGVIYINNHRYTYYQEHVLPGNGLNIPGRHHEDGFIKDKNGYVCVASSDFAKGTIVDIPFTGLKGKVYDCGCPSGTIDIYLE